MTLEIHSSMYDGLCSNVGSTAKLLLVDEEKPQNDSTQIPPGYSEDVKKFSVANVGATAVSQQLTEMMNANYYIIKEIRFYFSGTAIADAYFHVGAQSVDGAGARFIEGYYGEGSFCILAGNRNGKYGKVLTSKPHVFLSAGTGSAAQTVYGSVRYFYK